jgi:hypothetical protein
MREPDELLRPVDLGLSRDEVEFMVAGFGQWNGPARPEPGPAQLVGFDNADEMADGIPRLRDALRGGAPLSRRDWRRALIATELIFGSDAFGAGVEWEVVTGRDDRRDVGLLREIQRKLVGVCPPPPTE